MNITISNIPKEITNKYGTNVDYKTFIYFINKEKELEKKYFNKIKDNYGPFKSSLEAISFLNRKRGLNS